MKRFQFIDKSTGGSVKNDLLSGITVALALVPEAVAFAFVAGVSPVVGLYGAFMMGIITAILGFYTTCLFAWLTLHQAP